MPASTVSRNKLGPVRVLLAADHLGYGDGLHGVGSGLRALLPVFDPARVAVRLVALRGGEAVAPSFLACGIDLRLWKRRKPDPSVLMDFLKVIRRERIEVLHLQGYKADTLGRVAGLLTGVPAILHQADDSAEPPLAIRLADRWFARAAHPVAISRSVSDFLEKRRAIPRERVEIVRWGIDFERFAPARAEEREDARAEFGVPAQAPVAGALSRLHPVKGVLHLVEAVPHILRVLPEFRLLLAGDGPERARITAAVARLGIQEAVTLLGFQSDARRVLSALDVLVIPSLAEGFCLAMLEGLAMGKGIVASWVGGMAEVLEDDQTAILVPPADAAAIGAACLRLLTSPELLGRLSAAAMELSRSMSVTAVAAHWTAVYERLAGRAAHAEMGDGQAGSAAGAEPWAHRNPGRTTL